VPEEEEEKISAVSSVRSTGCQ